MEYCWSLNFGGMAKWNIVLREVNGNILNFWQSEQKFDIIIKVGKFIQFLYLSQFRDLV